jgi:elongation factor P
MGSGSIGEIRPSATICLDGNVFIVLDCTHVKQANRRASCMAKVRNMLTGQTLDITLRDSDNFDMAYIEKRPLQFSYHDGNLYHFMETETYEDLVLNEKQIEEQIPWLKDDLPLSGLFYNNALLSLELPLTMNLKVIETDPGYRGDTVKAGTKPAKLETGIVIQVPLFINPGEMIKVDTREKAYMSRI